MRVLVLVAHPDDEVIMCGATLNKLAKKGHTIYATFFTRNDQAYFAKESQEERRERAVAEAKKSGKLLGFTVQQLAYGDMELDKDRGALMRSVVSEIRRVKPHAIITQHPGDYHIDHATLGKIVPEANFQSGNELCGGNETWSADVVLQGEVNLEMTMPFDFDVVSEVTQGDLAAKLRAFNSYRSVMREHGSDKTWLQRKLEISSELRGRAAGVDRGEAFVIDAYTPLTSKPLARIVAITEV